MPRYRPMGLQPLLLCELRLHEHLRRRAVGQLRGVAGGNRAALDDRLQAGETLGGGRADALVSAHRDFRLGLFAGFLVPGDAPAGHGHELVCVAAGLVGGGGALLRLQAVLVHRFPADAVALRHHLGGLQHGHVDVRMHGHQLLVDHAVRVHVLVLHQGDGFEAAADHAVHAVVLDLLGRRGHRHQARGALPVQGHARHRDRQPRAQGDLPRDVLSGGALLQGGAHDDIVHRRRVDPGAAHRLGDCRSAEGGTGKVIEAAPVGLADGGAGGADNDRVSHAVLPAGFARLNPV